MVDYLLSVPGGKGRDLGVSDSDLSGLLCTAVLENDLEALKLFAAAAGPRLDAGDYDKRTALHIAAAEGNVPAIEVLLAGGANCGPRDRWCVFFSFCTFFSFFVFARLKFFFFKDSHFFPPEKKNEKQVVHPPARGRQGQAGRRDRRAARARGRRLGPGHRRERAVGPAVLRGGGQGR